MHTSCLVFFFPPHVLPPVKAFTLWLQDGRKDGGGIKTENVALILQNFKPLNKPGI